MPHFHRSVMATESMSTPMDLEGVDIDQVRAANILVEMGCKEEHDPSQEHTTTGSPISENLQFESADENPEASTSHNGSSSYFQKRSSSSAAQPQPHTTSPKSPDLAQIQNMSQDTDMMDDVSDSGTVEVGDDRDSHEDPDKYGWDIGTILRNTSLLPHWNSNQPRTPDSLPRLTTHNLMQNNTQHGSAASGYSQNLDAPWDMEDSEYPSTEVMPPSPSPQQPRWPGAGKEPNPELKSQVAVRIRESELVKVRKHYKISKDLDNMRKVTLRYKEFKSLMKLRNTPEKLATWSTKLMIDPIEDTPADIPDEAQPYGDHQEDETMGDSVFDDSQQESFGASGLVFDNYQQEHVPTSSSDAEIGQHMYPCHTPDTNVRHADDEDEDNHRNDEYLYVKSADGVGEPFPVEKGETELDAITGPLASLPPLPAKGEKPENHSYRFDHGMIQEYLTEAEMYQIRDGYSRDNQFALQCFKNPQSTSIKNAIKTMDKRIHGPDTRRTRITQAEWTKLHFLRGEGNLDYHKHYRGNISKEDRNRGNAFLVARLDRLKNNDKRRNRRIKAGSRRMGSQLRDNDEKY